MDCRGTHSFFYTVWSTLLACFLANGGEVGSHISVSGVGQLRKFFPGGAAWHKPELLLQDVCTLSCAGNTNLSSGNDHYHKNFH